MATASQLAKSTYQVGAAPDVLARALDGTAASSWHLFRVGPGVLRAMCIHVMRLQELTRWLC